jgi:hypothetical protein
MKIEIEIKPMAQMRYSTVGDYYILPDGSLKLEIADTGNVFYNFMVLVHEIIEYSLLAQRGVDIEIIDKFDTDFEKERKMGLHDLGDEPGFDYRSPYGREHTLATAVEMLMCAHAGLSWNDYNETIITM